MQRRQFLTETLSAAAAALLTTGGILALGSRGNTEKKRSRSAFPVKDFSTPRDPRYPALVVATSKDYRQAVAEAIKLVGGMERFVRSGDTVFIKPNIGWDRTPEQGADTHPQIVAELCRLCHEAGAGRVFVGDVTCNDPSRSYHRSGIMAAVEANKGKALIITEDLLQDVDLGNAEIGRWPVIKPLLEADRLINVPVVKHHSLCGMTAAMKNWLGAIGGSRNRLHQDIDRHLALLASAFRPTLTVLDATRVMQRNGPQGGNPADLVYYDSIVVSTDQVAVDAYATRFLSRRPAEFKFLSIAAEMGLGRVNLPESEIVRIQL